MDIALLTIWHEKNYGAELQAYATIKVLQQLGHKVEMIDIRLSDIRYRNFNQHIVDFISYFGQDDRSFRRFWKTHIPVTRRYKSIDELINNPPHADVYLVGSDQVWNPDITKELAKVFFLNFGPNNITRISYASSFGKEKWTHSCLSEFCCRQLENFRSLSCREESGVLLLKKEFNLKAKCVLDPTLLLEDYNDLIGDYHEDSTLVYYPLSSDEELENYSKLLATNLGLRPINNRKITLLAGCIPWTRVSIEEWVRNIAQAQFVITRSFHGLVFCLLYKRQFAILQSRNGRGDRLLNLLKLVHLEDRLYSDVNAISKSMPWNRKIDYTEITKIITVKRQDSLQYLKTTLDNLS